MRFKMDFKKYLNKTNILIFVCSLVVLGLFLFTSYNLIETYTNTTLTPENNIKCFKYLIL